MDSNQVVACYHAVLQREPENSSVVESWISSAISLEELLKGLLLSPEFKGRLTTEAGSFIFYRGVDPKIEIDASIEDKNTLRRQIEAVWSQYGKTDPYWSVMTSDTYRAANMNVAAEASFFDTGRADVQAFVDACARAQVPLNSEGTVLDFGCGVGRLGEHLSGLYRNYIGVDISANHLELARRRFLEIGRQNAHFQLLQSFLVDTRPFDLFFSLITLQHNPPPIIAWMLDLALGRVAPRGLAFFQVPTTILGRGFNVRERIADSEAFKVMEMHALPQREVFRLLSLHEFELLEVITDGKCGSIGLSHTFLARKRTR